MIAAQERIAVWLLPTANESAFLTSLISDFAARFEAPVFEPHLTLHGGGIVPVGTIRGLRSLEFPAGLELAIDTVASSAKYTKTLFVRFRLSPELLEMRNSVARALRLNAEDQFDPHLSLLYKDMPLAEKVELAQGLELPLGAVRFDRLKVIVHPAEIKTAADVRAWRTLDERPLAQ